MTSCSTHKTDKLSHPGHEIRSESIEVKFWKADHSELLLQIKNGTLIFPVTIFSSKLMSSFTASDIIFMGFFYFTLFCVVLLT